MQKEDARPPAVIAYGAACVFLTKVLVMLRQGIETERIAWTPQQDKMCLVINGNHQVAVIRNEQVICHKKIVHSTDFPRKCLRECVI